MTAREGPPVTPAPGAMPPGLDIRSDPPGAQIFLDDEPVGRTDPETGRLRLRAVAAGRHRVRLFAEGRDDVVREVYVAGQSVVVEGVLPPRQGAPAPAGTGSSFLAPAARGPVVVLVIGLVLAIVLWVWKQSVPPAGTVTGTAMPLRAEGRPDPGSDEVFPMPFGEYSLVRRIGKGGMAAVYEAVRRGETFALCLS